MRLRIAAVIIISCVGTILSHAQTCPSLETSTPGALTSYLNGVTDWRQDAPCIAFALKAIGETRYEPASSTVIKFLDFRWPVGAHQKQRLFVIEHDGATIYPAATALQQIGPKALPAVLNAIESRPLSRESMEVALSVWMTVYKAQAAAGVMLLNQEANKPGLPPYAKQRLIFAAYLAAQDWCAPADRAQCQAAAPVINHSPASGPRASNPM